MGNTYVNKLIICSFIVLSAIYYCKSERASTWYDCNCHWADWRAWSTCTAKCGGGIQERTRSVWVKDVPECDGFEYCGTAGSGSEIQTCNTVCYNGGTSRTNSFDRAYCSCKTGTKGNCCEQIVTCGSPSRTSNGTYTGSSFSYNHKVIYSCDTYYRMTDPSTAVRTCSHSGYWTGSLPRCEYSAYCRSSPCRNGGICTNLLGDYRCSCSKGWIGKNCKTDIQPPVYDHCPTNKIILTTKMTDNQTWTEPIFSDPHGFEIEISKNYQESSFEFPWGEFAIQYTAVKPSNGLREECIFWITVKPHQCKSLQAPRHGTLACNDWKKEYARVCKIYCYSGYDLPPGFKPDTVWNCGATGKWMPSNPFSECTVMNLLSSTSDVDSPKFNNCLTEKVSIANTYIRDLKLSQFNALCMDNIASCNVTNVSILCDN